MTEEDPDAILGRLLEQLDARRTTHVRRACPRKGCYEEQGHDENAHGMRMPATTNRSMRRGNQDQNPRRRRR